LHETDTEQVVGMFDRAGSHGLSLGDGQIGLASEDVSQQRQRAATALEGAQELLPGLGEEGCGIFMKRLASSPSNEADAPEQQNTGKTRNP